MRHPVAEIVKLDAADVVVVGLELDESFCGVEFDAGFVGSDVGVTGFDVGVAGVVAEVAGFEFDDGGIVL